MRDFTPLPIDIQPGLYSEQSEVDSRGRWSDGNNVRFWKRRPERIGGWDKVIDGQFDGAVRGAKGWLSNSQVAYLATGTATKLEVMTNGAIHDITPTNVGDGLGLLLTLTNTQIAPGLVDGSNNLAYGYGGYGTGYYGESQNPSFLGAGQTQVHPRTWSLDTFGEDLIAVARDNGNLFYWDSSTGTGTPASRIEAAPVGNLGVFTSEQSQHVVLYGAGGDPLKIEWCSQENINDWTPTDLNTAGGLRCDDGSSIVGAATTGLGHLILTDTAAYVMRYVGLPDVFSLQKVGSNCGLIGPLAIAADDNGAVWMSNNGFFQYNGSVQRLTCDVHNDVFTNINYEQAYKIAAGHNKKFNEAVFFYPKADQIENSNHVYFNQYGWGKGDVPRTSWVDEDVVAQYPIGFAPSGQPYLHEYGTKGDGLDISYSLTMGFTEVTDGRDFVHIRRIIPDWDRLTGNHTVTLKVKGWPNKTQRTKGPYTLANAEDALSVRARGRAISMTLSGSDDFRLGLFRAWIQPDGLAE